MERRRSPSCVSSTSALVRSGVACLVRRLKARLPAAALVLTCIALAPRVAEAQRGNATVAIEAVVVAPAPAVRFGVTFATLGARRSAPRLTVEGVRSGATEGYTTRWCAATGPDAVRCVEAVAPMARRRAVWPGSGWHLEVAPTGI